MENIEVRYHHFQPSEFSRVYVESSLEEIREESPWGAVIKASFTRQDGVIKGILQLHSSAGSFFAVAAESSLKDVVKRLADQIRRRIDRWETRRFKRQYENKELRRSHEKISC